jgi:hypothetical protein
LQVVEVVVLPGCVSSVAAPACSAAAASSDTRSSASWGHDERVIASVHWVSCLAQRKARTRGVRSHCRSRGCGSILCPPDAHRVADTDPWPTRPRGGGQKEGAGDARRGRADAVVRFHASLCLWCVRRGAVVVPSRRRVGFGATCRTGQTRGRGPGWRRASGGADRGTQTSTQEQGNKPHTRARRPPADCHCCLSLQSSCLPVAGVPHPRGVLKRASICGTPATPSPATPHTHTGSA